MSNPETLLDILLPLTEGDGMDILFQKVKTKGLSKRKWIVNITACPRTKPKMM